MSKNGDDLFTKNIGCGQCNFTGVRPSVYSAYGKELCSVCNGKGLKNIHQSPEISKGYHLSSIKKERYGSAEKLKEEVEELLDAVAQKNKIMTLVELSDIIGAMRGFLRESFPQISLDDVIKMNDATERAFNSGLRK